MKIIQNYTKEELENIFSPKFRAKQIFGWLYNRYAFDFDEMKNLPSNIKELLKKEYTINPLSIAKIENSSDGSRKYLFKLQDGLTVETVLLLMKEKKYDENGNISSKEKYTICISSQVGCKMGCKFCFTTKEGFKRNLSAGEIVEQVRMVQADNDIPSTDGVNLVFMGMGEPLDNLDNVAKAIEIFKDPDGLAISPRRQTVSTSGLASKIEKLGLMDLGILLAISLHAVNDTLRSSIMPVNKAYNIQSVIEAVKRFPIDARKRIMFEYLVMGELNDDLKSAKDLVRLLDGIKAKVNLIYFNPHPGSEFNRPSEENMIKFRDFLQNKGLLATIRESKGLDISAACGQLREKQLKN